MALAYPWGDTLAALRTADLRLVNLECVMTDRQERWADGAHKAFYFRATPATIESLRRAHVDFAALANNHSLDFGARGMLDTVRLLDGARIAHAGAGEDEDAAQEPALLAARGQRISVLSYADYPAEWAASDDSPGINYLPVSMAPEIQDRLRRALARARAESDLVLLSVHWGPNMRLRPTPEFREFARAAVDAGADVFWGHSAHVAQGVELWGGKPILYDTGDFVDDYAVDPELRNDLSAIFLLELEPPHVRRVRIVPVSIGAMQVNLARGRDREVFLERMGRLCAELGTSLRGGEAEVEIAPAPAGNM